MKQLQKKLRSRRGMSLTEVLVAVAILSLVTLGVAVGVSASLRVYRQSVALSDAQTLSSTLSIAMMDELRYARDIQEDGRFSSTIFGNGVAFGTDGDGHITLGGQLLVGKGAYAGLTATVEVSNQFDVKLEIWDGDTSIQTIAFSVVPLNADNSSS